MSLANNPRITVTIEGVEIYSAHCELCGQLVDVCAPDTFERHFHGLVHVKCEDAFRAHEFEIATRP